MANESLLGAGLRSSNSPTLAYSGYNHGVPIGNDITLDSYHGAIPAPTDFGENNFRIPWTTFNTTDGGNTRMYNLTAAQQISTMYGTAASPLVFYSGNANGNERYTADYQNNESHRMAKASDGQTWHLRCIVRNGNENTSQPSHDIAFFVFGLDENEQFNFSGYDIHEVTADKSDPALNIAITGNELPPEFQQTNLEDGTVTHNIQPSDGTRIGGQINFGSQDNPIDVANTSTYAFRVHNYLSPGAITVVNGLFFVIRADWWDINAYFTIRNSDVKSLAVRVDFDNADNNKSFVIDKWSLRPINVSMSNIHSGTDISLANDVYDDINTTPP